MRIEAAANCRNCGAQASGTIPKYLQGNYWWAYVHPNAVRLFRTSTARQHHTTGEYCATARRRVGRIRCYDLRTDIADRMCLWRLLAPARRTVAAGSSLDVVDVLPIQLQNLRCKLTASTSVTLYQRDSTALSFGDASYDQAIIFFLLHEQPAVVRKQTITEALRVVKPGGKLVIVDYHRPAYRHPLRHLLRPVLRVLEPYALDLWDHEIGKWLPSLLRPTQVRKTTFYGSLYQKLVITPSW